MTRLLILILLSSCTTLNTHDFKQTLGSICVTDYGAVTGDGLDDRAAFQAALSSGAADVLVPDGVYDFSPAGGARNLTVPAGVTLRGETRDGAVLRQMCGQGASTRLLHITGSHVVIRDLTLYGQADIAGCQTVDEHRSGTFVQAPPGTAIWDVTVERVTSRGFSGDGFYTFVAGDPADPTNPEHVGTTYRDVLSYDNQRNGLTWGGLVYSGLVVDSTLAGNRVQQLDSETGTTGHLDNITVVANTIDPAGASNDYALTISGGSSASHSHNWRVENNTINGAINIVWADDVRVIGNVGVNASTKPAVTAWRDNGVVFIADNTFTNTQTSTINSAVIYLSGTGVGSVPTSTRIEHNVLSSSGIAKTFGIRAEGCGSVEILRNVIAGPGLAAPGYAGIALRATLVGQDFESVRVHDNTVRDWGGVGLSVTGNGAARLNLLEVTGNTFTDTSLVPTQLTAMMLDADRTHAARDIRVAANTLTGGCTTWAGGTMTGAWSAWGDRWVLP